MIDVDHPISISKQCDLLGISRSHYYYKPIAETQCNLKLMKQIDKQYLETPYYGSRLMTAELRKQGYVVNRKRVARLMRQMGIRALFPEPKRENRVSKYGKFPYLLKDLQIVSPNQVWGTDITYIPVEHGYLYLCAILDLYSRCILGLSLSNSLESSFCIEAMDIALQRGKPKILNSDQGVQFTSHEYVELVQGHGIEISMAGRGRCWDNILVERLWRSLKYEEVYLNHYSGFEEANEGIRNYVEIYNNRRPHSALNYRTPSEVYGNRLGASPQTP